jgi:hypothetical protein
VSGLSLRLSAGQALEPGGRLTGRVVWNATRPPEIAIALGWRTSGKGTVDQGVGAATVITGTTAAGEAHFELAIPAGPPSFSGKLVSVGWQLTAQDKHSGDSAVLDLVIAPGGREIRLG